MQSNSSLLNPCPNRIVVLSECGPTGCPASLRNPGLYQEISTGACLTRSLQRNPEKIAFGAVETSPAEPYILCLFPFDTQQPVAYTASIEKRIFLAGGCAPLPFSSATPFGDFEEFP